jgi:hypothetical protein
MKSKQLSKSAAEKLEKFLKSRETIVDKFEDMIEDTVFDKPYYYLYRKFKFGYLNPRTAYYKVMYGVQNLIKWFPIIWNDRDWDWHYWLEMNIKKLEGMEESIRNGCHVHCERDADQIKLALLALKRLESDEYHEMVFKPHDKKWGKLDTSFGQPDEQKCVEMLFNRDNVRTAEDEKQERKEFMRLMKHRDYLQKQDLEYATKIISKYLFGWWD